MSSISRRVDSVYIWQGDDLARIKELRARAEEAAKAEATGPRLMGEKSEAREFAEEHDEFVAEAKARAIKVTIREVGRRRWRELMNEHPPRPDNESDAQLGVNEDSFSEALVRASIIEPMFPTVEELDEFVDNLNAGVFDQLYVRAFTLNRSGVVDPKASLASELIRRSDET